jgi:D-alanyl-D-alanine carboxypeptidase
MRSSALRIATAAMAALLIGCSAPQGSGQTSSEPRSVVDAGATAPPSQPSSTTRLGGFPEFPRLALPDEVAASLQAVLDEAVKQGAFDGVTASVIVADSGSWAGATGVDPEGNLLTRDSHLPTASVGKTVTAAEILFLAEEGKLGLDDPAADYLPSKLAPFDANGATIRDLLGMRSGIPDPAGYIALVDAGASPADLVKEIPGSLSPPGSEILYANINYVLLGMIIEHVTDRPLWDALASGVLDRPGLDGLVYRMKGALAADGGGMESDATSLARWGYELYGGFVLSDASFRQMTNFHGDWYGLGAIDFGHGTPAVAPFGIPAIGHGGEEPPTVVVMLIAFPQTDAVIAVQANGGSLAQVAMLVEALREAAQP